MILISLVSLSPWVASRIHIALPKFNDQPLVLWPLLLVLIGVFLLRVMQLSARSFALVLICVSIANAMTTDLRSFDVGNSQRNENRYLVVLKAIPVIHGHNSDGNLRFWYSSKEPHGGVYRAVASTHLWA